MIAQVWKRNVAVALFVGLFAVFASNVSHADIIIDDFSVSSTQDSFDTNIPTVGDFRDHFVSTGAANSSVTGGALVFNGVNNTTFLHYDAVSGSSTDGLEEITGKFLSSYLPSAPLNFSAGDRFRVTVAGLTSGTITWDLAARDTDGDQSFTSSPVAISGNGTWDMLFSTFNPLVGFNKIGAMEVRFTAAGVNNLATIDNFLVVTAEAVPEPSTFVLAALGLVGLGFVALRKKYRRA